ncbi:MAG TPA: hypothetical protein VH815_16725 [Acidobacteriota bacterium]
MGTDGTVAIFAKNFKRVLFVRHKTPSEKFESVRKVILQEGYVFTEKVEKMTRKEVGFKNGQKKSSI